MGCTAISIETFQLFLCAAGSMWDDPRSEGLRAFLEAENERQWLAYEQELDLARERELDPPTEEIESEVLPAELSAVIEEWDAYGPD